MSDNPTPTIISPKTLTRSISLPVQEVMGEGSPHDLWRAFERQVIRCWELSTSLANWASHTLRSMDVVRTPAMKELPKIRAVDLYGLAFGREKDGVGRQRFCCPSCKRTFAPCHVEDGLVPTHPRGKGACPGGQAVSLDRKTLPALEVAYTDADAWAGGKIAAATLLRKVDRDYRTWRGKIVWQQARRSPEYLFPHPFPVHQQQWTCWTEKGRPFVSMNLPGGRVTLRLKNGPEFAPAVKIFKGIEEGKIKQLECKLDSQSSRAHCRLVRDKRPGDEPARELRLILRIAYETEIWASQAVKTAYVTTGKEPFLSLSIPGEDRSFVLHAPWVKVWIDDHRRFLDCFADDLKHEKRWPRKARKRCNRRLASGCERHDNRMKSFRQETAHQFVSHAARRGCGKIVYDDGDRSFAEQFPWHLLSSEFQDECDVQGMVFQAASGAAVNGENVIENDATE